MSPGRPIVGVFSSGVDDPTRNAALEWFVRGCNLGDTLACDKAYLIMVGGGAVSRNLRKASEYSVTACEHGDCRSFSQLQCLEQIATPKQRRPQYEDQCPGKTYESPVPGDWQRLDDCSADMNMLGCAPQGAKDGHVYYCCGLKAREGTRRTPEPKSASKVAASCTDECIVDDECNIRRPKGTARDCCHPIIRAPGGYQAAKKCEAQFASQKQDLPSTGDRCLDECLEKSGGTQFGQCQLSCGVEP